MRRVETRNAQRVPASPPLPWESPSFRQRRRTFLNLDVKQWGSFLTVYDAEDRRGVPTRNIGAWKPNAVKSNERAAPCQGALDESRESLQRQPRAPLRRLHGRRPLPLMRGNIFSAIGKASKRHAVAVSLERFLQRNIRVSQHLPQIFRRIRVWCSRSPVASLHKLDVYRREVSGPPLCALLKCSTGSVSSVRCSSGHTCFVLTSATKTQARQRACHVRDVCHVRSSLIPLVLGENTHFSFSGNSDANRSLRELGQRHKVMRFDQQTISKFFFCYSFQCMAKRSIKIQNFSVTRDMLLQTAMAKKILRRCGWLRICQSSLRTLSWNSHALRLEKWQ